MWNRILEMLRGAGESSRSFPPTLLYNENWMLRVVLDWLVTNGGASSLIPVLPHASWYSEPLLPSAFLARRRGDPLSESYTRADGVVGHFTIGGKGKGDMVLAPAAEQFTVIEGKMFSGLSRGVKNAPFFDQAARNVACMAEVLKAAKQPPSTLSQLSFHVIAPRSQVTRGVFDDQVSKGSIAEKVKRRVDAFDGARDEWLELWFMPTLQRIDASMLSWEDIISHVHDADARFGADLRRFYQDCVRFNCSPSMGARLSAGYEEPV